MSGTGFASTRSIETSAGMRDDGVLVGIDGPHSNVLKIRPPLVFREADADQLVDALDRALQSL